MQRVIVDMDDVIADATGQFIKYYERDYGVRVTRESLNNHEEGNGFPAHHDEIRKYPHTNSFFRTMDVKEDSQKILAEINLKYELYIVSAAVQFPQSLIEKYEWLKEHFDFISWRQIVFCGSKAVVHGDYMIDDLPVNLANFNGEKYLFSAPHNMHYNTYKRVNSWKEIGDLLL